MIDQTNVSGQNIAIVIQIYTKPQTASQTASITQRNTDGSNLAAIVQIVKQSSQSAITQTDVQDASFIQIGNNPLTTDTGRNLSILLQSSMQFGQSGSALDVQEQDSTERGHVDQSRGGVSKALAGESQSQTLKGPGQQTQHLDPHCCASQQSNPNNDFEIRQLANQFAENTAARSQDSSTIGDCSSSGHCGIDQTASINGQSQHQHTDCTAASCSNAIACSTTTGCVPCPPPGFVEAGQCFTDTAPVAFNNRGTTIGRGAAILAVRWTAASRSSSASSARSATTTALLT